VRLENKDKNIFFYIETNVVVFYNAGAVVVNPEIIGSAPEPNPTTSLFYASVLKLQRNKLLTVFLEQKLLFPSIYKRSSLLQRWRCSYM
jgi:hypothetical protein